MSLGYHDAVDVLSAQLTRDLFAIAKFLFIEIWRFKDFQIGGRPPSWIFKIGGFCHAAFVGMPLCFTLQYLAEIGQLVHQLWPTKQY